MVGEDGCIGFAIIMESKMRNFFCVYVIICCCDDLFS